MDGLSGNLGAPQATLLDAEHLRFGPLIKPGRAPGDRMAERRQALDVYQQYASSVGAVRIRHVDLGVGCVPGNRGTVQLDALLACVHDPEPARAGAPEDSLARFAEPIRPIQGRKR